MRTKLIAIAAALWAGISTARPCGSGTESSLTYQWSISDWTFDGPEPDEANDSNAVVGTYLIPSGTRTLHSCISTWPEAWGGYFEGGDRLVWGYCIWTGPGAQTDDTVGFAMDWKNRTLYMAHIFACDDAPNQGSMRVATGSMALDVECDRADVNSRERCLTKAESVDIETYQEPASLAASAACTDNSERWQSWRIENYTRQYEQPPDTVSSISTAADSGPTFTLHNMVNGNTLSCTSGPEGVEGTCTPESGESTTTATFSFDPILSMLVITQNWDCGDGAEPFEATGAGYVPARCRRAGDTFNCDSDPFLIGAKK